MNAATSSHRSGSDRLEAEVIPFPRPAPRRFRRETAECGDGLGRILLFTGVRYERMPEPAPREAAPRKRTRGPLPTSAATAKPGRGKARQPA